MTHLAPSAHSDPEVSATVSRAGDTRPAPSQSTRRRARGTPFLRRLVPHSSRGIKNLVAAAVSTRRDPPPLTVANRHSPEFEAVVDVDARELTVSGDLDMAAVNPFTVAAASLTVGRRGGVTVDLTNLRFIDAAGLGAVVALRNILHSSGQSLALRNANPRIVRTFGLGGLSDFLDSQG